MYSNVYSNEPDFLLDMESTFDDSHEEDDEEEEKIITIREEIRLIKARLEPIETKMADITLIMDRVQGVPTNPISSTIVYRQKKREVDDDLGSISQEEDEFIQKCPLYFSFNTWCCCSS